MSLWAPLASLMMVFIEAVSRLMVGYCFKIPGTEDFIKKINILIKNRSHLCAIRNHKLQPIRGVSIFKILL